MPTWPANAAFWRRAPDAPVLWMAHRGAPHLFVENTLQSFAAAEAAGADVLEMDVRTSADGALVIFHDATLERVTFGAGPLAEQRLAPLRALALRPIAQSLPGSPCSRARIALLHEVFAKFWHMPMNIDLKAVDQRGVKQLFAMLRHFTKQRDQAPTVLLTAERDETHAAIAACNSDGIVTQGMSRNDVKEVIRAAWLCLTPPQRLRFRACQMPAHLRLGAWRLPLWWGPLRHMLRRLQCPWHVWWDDQSMVDDPSQWRVCAHAGVDGVFTDTIHKRRKHPVFVE